MFCSSFGGVVFPPDHSSDKILLTKYFITNATQIIELCIVNANKNSAVLCKQLLQKPQPGIHHAQPFVMTGEVFALFADYLSEPLTDAGIIHVVVVDPPLIAGVVGRIDVDKPVGLSALPGCRRE